MTVNALRIPRGFTLIELVMVIVIGSVIAATLVVFVKPAVDGYLASRAVLRFGSVAQATSAQNLLSARVSQAARAGTEWGLYQAFKGSWTACSGASQTLDLTASTGFRVTVSCDSRTFNEGESAPGTPRAVRIYTIDAVACSSSTSCPDNSAATAPNYIERRRQVHASD